MDKWNHEAEGGNGMCQLIVTDRMKNGTKLKITMNCEAEEYTEQDLEELLSRIASTSHEFYLETGKILSSKHL